MEPPSPALDPAKRVLLSASTGAISLTQAAREVELPDAGYVPRRLAGAGLPQPLLSAEEASRQFEAARADLDACLVQPADTGKSKRSKKPAKS